MGHPAVRRHFEARCRFESTDYTPVLAMGLEFDWRYCGLTYGDTRQDVDKMVACQQKVADDFGYDLSIIFPDDYVELEHLGMTMSDDPLLPTTALQHLPMDMSTLQLFDQPDLTRVGRCPIHLEMIRRVRELFGDTMLVMGRVAAPYSAMSLVYGIDEVMVNTLAEPELLKANLPWFADHQAAYARAQLDAGADIIWIGDDVASSRFLRLEHYQECAFEAAAAVAQAVRDAGGLSIYQADENSIPHLQQQAQLPVDAVNVGHEVRLADVRQAIGRTRCLTGNLYPLLLRDGTPDQVANTVRTIVSENAPAGGYMFNTSEGITQNSKPENVMAMMQAARNNQ